MKVSTVFCTLLLGKFVEMQEDKGSDKQEGLIKLLKPWAGRQVQEQGMYVVADRRPHLFDNCPRRWMTNRQEKPIANIPCECTHVLEELTQ